MAGQPYGNPELPPTTPAGYAPVTSQAGWPTAIGIIMIIFGAFGTIGSVFGLFAWQLIKFALKQTGDNADIFQAPLIQRSIQITTAFAGLGVVVAILLLVAGIGIIKRRAWAVKASTLWAILKIALATANGVATWIMQHKIAEAISAGAIDAEAGKIIRGGASPLSMLPGLIWACALPVFILIWLSLPNSKQETARWT